MDTYFISSPEETDWKINSTSLMQSLILRWSDAAISKIDNPKSIYSLEWTLQMKEMQLEGTLTKDGKTIHLEGDPLDCVNFALWFRLQTPINHKLIFFNEQYYAHIELEEETTEAQLVKTFLLE